MSDTDENRIFNGNSAVQPSVDGDGRGYPGTPRPLAEEAIEITLADLRRLCGHKELLKAAKEALPIRIQIQQNVFTIYLVSAPHRLPDRHRGASDREGTRLWLVCMDCRRKVRKLFSFSKFQGSNVLCSPFCRDCLGLTYQSQNCGGNTWWRETARPVKRLLQKRKRLLARKQTPGVQAQLEEVDRLIWIMRQRAKPKSSPRRRLSQYAGAKRPYRDLGPILQSLPC